MSFTPSNVFRLERPLDYEIGSLTTFSRRRDRLDDKVTQVLTLADFLRANPRGTKSVRTTMVA